MPFVSSPRAPIATTHRYTIRPRDKKTFNTPLDARDLVDAGGTRQSTISVDARPDGAVFTAEHPLRAGTIRETLRCVPRGGGLASDQLERQVLDLEEQVVRSETVAFASTTVPLPAVCYPEVLLPFLLALQPQDKTERALYAWINDRFVAKVQYCGQGTTRLDLGGRRVEAWHTVMYPDFNDWVRIGNLLSKLARPFVPKYQMWFETTAPYGVLRFEGPYGPPGAPELILERVS